MPEVRQMIRGRAVVSAQAHYAHAHTDVHLAPDALPSLPVFLEKVGAGETATAQLGGVWLSPDDDPAALQPYLSRLSVVAVEFPKFVEGRGYSTAYLLRQRFGYTGELRAFGDIGRDHLWQLARTGFDAFDLRDGTDLEDAVKAFADFPERYQSSVDQPAPLFRRRELAHG